eukprot:TRINITY_DN5546_c0_g1_i1.p1 TRINITY_DN5546_c0_g1~~TRINITY_DN5546_c0_g1_i1.p1  ORF type:complete len:346 (+),score=74.97 TRINITY_DN5546_c0_g1_i1:37-1038(+)
MAKGLSLVEAAGFHYNSRCSQPFQLASSFAEVSRGRPPISCADPAAEREEFLDVLRSHAKGEMQLGRKDGPAEQALAKMEKKVRLEAADAHAKAQAQGESLKEGKDKLVNSLKSQLGAKDKAEFHDTEGMEEETVIKTPWKEERIWKVKQKNKVPKLKPLRVEEHIGAGPKMLSRSALIDEGPFPLRQKISELAAHTYYLWGSADFVNYLSKGTTAEHVARNLEGLAKQAEMDAHALVEEAHIPVSANEPGLPIEVSSTSALAAVSVVGPPLLISSCSSTTSNNSSITTNDSSTTNNSCSSTNNSCSSITSIGSSTTIQNRPLHRVSRTGDFF